jgi:ABC-type sugar transport systems, permease components
MGFTKNNKMKYIPYIFIGPAILYLIAVTVIPALMALPISLTDWTALSPGMNFVGMDNYKKLFTDDYFLQSLVIMAEFFLSVPLVLAVGLFVALFLNKKIKGMTIFRVVYYSPVITSTIAAAVIFDWLFQPTFGLFNSILGFFGLQGIGWVTDAKTAVMSVIIFKIWKDFGIAMLIYLAGLQDIPSTLIEAADIDGATPLKKFRYIIFPLLRPANIYLLITFVIKIFMIFQETYMFKDEAPLRSTIAVVNYIFEKGFGSSEMGYASAMSFVLFVVILAVTLLQYKFLDVDLE